MKIVYLLYRYVYHFSRKPRVVPTYGICVRESLNELDFNPDIIAKFQFPETPPWTYPTPMASLIYKVKKDYI